MKPIYLDHHATTPMDPRVLQEMMPYFTENFGNASSMDHTYGYDASVAVESARERIAKAIGARHDEIVFTSGATESDNIALIGTMQRYRDRGNHLITCTTEHKAVLDTAKYLESAGKTVTYLPVNEYGQIDHDALEDAITDETVMISVMAANNEVGTVADVAEIGRIAHEKGVIFHTDAAQAVGHIPVNVRDMNIDLMSFSAHKMYGPNGIGALYIRGVGPRIRPMGIMHGGGQERDIRSGTLNVPGIVGFGRAMEIATNEMEPENRRFRQWTNEMMAVFEVIGGELNGHKTERLAHNLNVCFLGIEGRQLSIQFQKKLRYQRAPHALPKTLRHRMSFSRLATMRAGSLIYTHRAWQVQQKGRDRLLHGKNTRDCADAQEHLRLACMNKYRMPVIFFLSVGHEPLSYRTNPPGCPRFLSRTPYFTQKGAVVRAKAPMVTSDSGHLCCASRLSVTLRRQVS